MVSYPVSLSDRDLAERRALRLCGLCVAALLLFAFTSGVLVEYVLMRFVA